MSKGENFAGRILRSDEALRAIVNAKPRQFKAPKVQEPPRDIADRLDWAAEGADELGLGADGLRGGSKLLRVAAAEIRRLRARTQNTPDSQRGGA